MPSDTRSAGRDGALEALPEVGAPGTLDPSRLALVVATAIFCACLVTMTVLAFEGSTDRFAASRSTAAGRS